MNLDDARLVPVPGDTGLACRFPGVILFCGARAPEEGVVELIGRCRQAARTPAPGGPLARQLAGVLATAEAVLPPFAMAAHTERGIAVLVHGSVDVHFCDEAGEDSLSGDRSITWVDRLLVGECTALAIHPTGAAAGEPAPHVDLLEGVVPAAGLQLAARSPGPHVDPSGVGRPPPVPADLPAHETPAPGVGRPADGRASTGVEVDPSLEPTSDMPHAPPPGPLAPIEDREVQVPDGVEFESVLLQQAHPDDPAGTDREAREPLPVEPDPSEIRTAESEIGGVVVQGVSCSRRHFNDPRSRFCSSCGISMVHHTRNPVPGPRPPLGVIVFEDGTTYSLGSDYVVGRQPELDPRVLQGLALPLVLEDDERTVSRAHAELRLVDWDVHFINLSRTNGSFVWDDQSGRWLPVTDRPVLLAPGTRIALGRRTAVFESSLVR